MDLFNCYNPLSDADWAAVPKVKPCPPRHLLTRQVTGYAPAARCQEPGCGRSWQGGDAAVLAREHTARSGHRTVAEARRVRVDCFSLGRREGEDEVSDE